MSQALGDQKFGVFKGIPYFMSGIHRYIYIILIMDDQRRGFYCIGGNGTRKLLEILLEFVVEICFHASGVLWAKTQIPDELLGYMGDRVPGSYDDQSARIHSFFYCSQTCHASKRMTDNSIKRAIK